MTTLRSHRSDDIPELIALAKRAWAGVEESIDAVLGSPLDRLATPSWAAHHEAVVREACESPESSAVVAEGESGKLVGFVAYVVHPESPGMSEYGEITVIAVDPSARRSGLGRRLLDHAVEQLGALAVPVIMLSTGGDVGHAPARALYESAGFRLLPIAQYWRAGAERP
jgi:ribosomal protein S18 acetylase RimI-like enzyme